MKVFYHLIIVGLFFGAVIWPAYGDLYVQESQSRGEVTGLELPRFVSLRSSKVFMRSGPGLRYPVKWVYVRQNFPVEIVQEFDTWRKIKDADGTEGWVHQSLLTGRRYAFVTARQTVDAYDDDNVNAGVAMRLEPEAIARILECYEQWCEISASGFNGWIEKKHIWGVYASERID